MTVAWGNFRLDAGRRGGGASHLAGLVVEARHAPELLHLFGVHVVDLHGGGFARRRPPRCATPSAIRPLFGNCLGAIVTAVSAALRRIDCVHRGRAAQLPPARTVQGLQPGRSFFFFLSAPLAPPRRSSLARPGRGRRDALVVLRRGGDEPLRRRGAGTPRRSSATTSSSFRRAPRHDVPRGHGRVRRRARGVVPPARRRRGRPRPARVPLRGGDRQGPVRHVRANRPHPARRRVGARHGDVVVGGSRAHQAPPARLLLRLLLRRLLLLPPRRGFPGFSRAEGFRHRRRRPRDVRDPPLRRVRRPEMAQRHVDAGRRRRPMARPRRPARPAPEVGTRRPPPRRATSPSYAPAARSAATCGRSGTSPESPPRQRTTPPPAEVSIGPRKTPEPPTQL